MDMLSRLQTAKSKKGFTLIELLAVIAIIAVLVLIAAPSFLGSKEKANLALIKADVKTVTNAVSLELLKSNTLGEQEKELSKEGFEVYKPSGKFTPYNVYGKFEGDIGLGGTLYDVSSLVDSSLNKKGIFVGNDKGEVFYLAGAKPNENSNIEKEPEYTPNPISDFEWIIDPSGYDFSTKK